MKHHSNIRGHLRCERLEDRLLLAADDISIVPFWDGETMDPSGPLLNRFGGNPIGGSAADIAYETNVVHSGNGGYRIDTNAEIPPLSYDSVGVSLTGFWDGGTYVDTRDITGFEEVQFWLRNSTSSPFNFVFEIKDYRDSLDHRARRTYAIPASDQWMPISVPLDFQDGWDVTGNPDLTRTKLFAFVVETGATPVNGSIHIDDMMLVERGGALNPRTADAHTLLERLAKRQFRGIWGSRYRETGLVPKISSFANEMALNSTAGLIQMLPKAVELEWISLDKANAYMARVAGTLNTVWDQVLADENGGYVPPRYIDRVTLKPTEGSEESSIDAAFLFLAIYRYRALTTTSTELRSTLDSLLARFNFAAFSSPEGWLRKYDYVEKDFPPGTYDGYSGEVYAISLAAQLAPNHQVDIATHWNSATFRSKTSLVDSAESHLVHSFEEYRAPFLQWLFPLLVDVRARGSDTYPNVNLAGNPFWNAVLYQREVNRKLAELGRATFSQPDAGDDGSGAKYEQFSLYDDFGEPDLFMPWSSTFGLLAEPSFAEAALRDLLARDFHGPLGLSDSVHVATGADQPTSISARHDFWNLTLSTWALMQYLHGGNEDLASLPEVDAALDKVLPAVAPKGDVPESLASSRNWIAYAPRHYNPNTGQYPSEDQLRADLQQLYDDGWRGLVTYTLDGSLYLVPRLAKEIGFTTVVAGLYWYDADQLAREKSRVPEVTPFADAFVLGNEGLLEGRYSRAALLDELDVLRTQTGKPVATTETGGQYLADPSLMDIGDWVFPNIQPYCGDPAIQDVSAAVEHVANEFLAIRNLAQARTPGRLIVLKESWWPTAGQAAATENNQAEYFRQLTRTPTLFVWGESFDQSWKFEPGCSDQGPNWGLYTSAGDFKATIPQLHGVYESDYVDSDGDGATNAMEMSAPNDGDGNQDGIQDYLQSNVASLANNTTGTYVTLGAPAGLFFTHVRALDNPSPEDTPRGHDFHEGFFEFEVNGMTTGSDVAVQMLLERYKEINSFYQYGPTSDDPSPHWYRFLLRSGTGAVLLAERMEIHLKDGERGDNDLTANGVVRFVGAPANDQRPFPWRNPVHEIDVDDDGWITPLDVLLVINYINNHPGDRLLPVPPMPPRVAYAFLDVTGDNRVEPIDALQLINHINTLGSHELVDGGDNGGNQSKAGEAEGESSSVPSLVSWQDPNKARHDGHFARLGRITRDNHTIRRNQPVTSRITDGIFSGRPERHLRTSDRHDIRIGNHELTDVHALDDDLFERIKLESILSTIAREISSLDHATWDDAL